MRINVEKIKWQLNELKNIIDEYENTCLNIYNELSNCSFFWYDDKAKMFFNDLSKEKVKVNTTVNELKENYQIYQYIVTSYEKIGKKIYVDIQESENVKKKIDEFIEVTEKIILNYKKLDLKNCVEIYDNINLQIKKIELILNNAITIKNNIQKFYENIKNIEKQVNLKISKIKIEYIKESNINDYV